MTPLWLELLMTPMAAPETAWRRAMRLSIVTIAPIVAVAASQIDRLQRWFGIVGMAMLLGLCLTLVGLCLVYAVVKHRADAAHLERLTGKER